MYPGCDAWIWLQLSTLLIEILGAGEMDQAVGLVRSGFSSQLQSVPASFEECSGSELVDGNYFFICLPNK